MIIKLFESLFKQQNKLKIALYIAKNNGKSYAAAIALVGGLYKITTMYECFELNNLESFKTSLGRLIRNALHTKVSDSHCEPSGNDPIQVLLKIRSYKALIQNFYHIHLSWCERQNVLELTVFVSSKNARYLDSGPKPISPIIVGNNVDKIDFDRVYEGLQIQLKKLVEYEKTSN